MATVVLERIRYASGGMCAVAVNSEVTDGLGSSTTCDADAEEPSKLLAELNPRLGSLSVA